MIARLKGLVEELGEDYLVLDVNGVGYLVFCASRTLAGLSQGQSAALFIETHVREDHIHLYGFANRGEKDWFNLLLTVQGVGAKVGLAILSVATPEQLVQGIAAQDRTVFTRASGVGPKLAVRILTELKDKAGKIALGGFVPAGTTAAMAAQPAQGGMMEDAVSALVNLGYRRIEAFEAVGRVLAQQGDGTDAGTLIRLALRELGKDLGK